MNDNQNKAVTELQNGRGPFQPQPFCNHCRWKWKSTLLIDRSAQPLHQRAPKALGRKKVQGIILRQPSPLHQPWPHKAWQSPQSLKHPPLSPFPPQQLGAKPASTCLDSIVQAWRSFGGTGLQPLTGCSHRLEMPPEHAILKSFSPELHNVSWRLDLALLALGKCRNTVRYELFFF